MSSLLDEMKVDEELGEQYCRHCTAKLVRVKIYKDDSNIQSNYKCCFVCNRCQEYVLVLK